VIDLHSHILPGLDDGAKTLQESIEMGLIGFKDGIRTVVATPHTLNGVYQNDRSTILAKVQELNSAIKQLGVQKTQSAICNPQSAIVNSHSNVVDPKSAFRNPHSAISLTVLPGADVHFSTELLNEIDEGKALTIGDGGRYLLLEFPVQGIPYGVEEVLFQLMIRGITPIISHPERNLEITLKPQRYFEMIKVGCFGQVTAMSLTGGFGGDVKRVAEKLLKARLVHIIASDAHSQNSRPPILSSAVRAAARIVGEEEAHKMVTEYPQAILDGQIPNIP
jgi:protein-tyrosine phosphatase